MPNSIHGKPPDTIMVDGPVEAESELLELNPRRRDAIWIGYWLGNDAKKEYLEADSVQVRSRILAEAEWLSGMYFNNLAAAMWGKA